MRKRRRLVTATLVDHALAVAAVLFALGLLGVLMRRNLIFILLSLEVMLNATGLAFIAAGARWEQADGQIMFLLVITLAAVEVAIALALILQVYRRFHTLDAGAVALSLHHEHDIFRMGGLRRERPLAFWAAAPRISAIGLLFAIAALGLPGFGNFVGEFLVFLGAYAASPTLAAVAVLGLVTAVLYALALVQKSFHDAQRKDPGPTDFGARETAVMGVMIVFILYLGLYPQPLFDLTTPVLRVLLDIPGQGLTLAGGMP